MIYLQLHTCTWARVIACGSLEQGENLEDTPPWLILTVWHGGGKVAGERQEAKNRLFEKKTSAMTETSHVILSYLHDSVCVCVQMHK